MWPHLPVPAVQPAPAALPHLPQGHRAPATAVHVTSSRGSGPPGAPPTAELASPRCRKQGDVLYTTCIQDDTNPVALPDAAASALMCIDGIYQHMQCDGSWEVGFGVRRWGPRKPWARGLGGQHGASKRTKNSASRVERRERGEGVESAGHQHARSIALSSEKPHRQGGVVSGVSRRCLPACLLAGSRLATDWRCVGRHRERRGDAGNESCRCGWGAASTPGAQPGGRSSRHAVDSAAAGDPGRQQRPQVQRARV